MPANDEDSQQRFALGFLFALIALVVFTVVGVTVYKYGIAHAPAPVAMAPAAPAVPATPAAPAVPAMAVVSETVVAVVPEGASIQVGNGVVNFYFATGSADLAPGAAEALATVIQGVQGGRKAVVSGFHDTTGDAAINEQLARKRAQMVQDVLVGLGVPASKVELRKPAVTTASGSNAEARRVEVRLVD
ncbi:MAG: hypothetical protein JWQ03_1596 [Variovorax sp.]|nr:hypothetical protein [Variovorax sp.]